MGKSIKSKEAAIPSIDRLRYRNQFVLGPRFLENLASWNRTKITGSIVLSTHPELNVCQAVNDGKSITLIGFMLDPENPLAGDADIVNGLIRDFTDFQQLINGTKRFGGRWAIIAKAGNGVELFNDPAGLRQIFYTDPRKTRDLWCASQPGMLADILGTNMCREGIDYINSYEFRNNLEFRWPGVSTPYEEIFHVLPNHSLDLMHASCRRFWPKRALEITSLESSIEKCSSLLQGLLRSASQRFDLALGVTSGLGSRVVLAASNGLNNGLSYMTVRRIGMADNHSDIAIPAQLLSRHGLPHDVVVSSLIIDRDFLNIFRNNTAISHTVYASDANAIRKYYSGKHGRPFVAVTGSGSKIARSSFRAETRKPAHKAITPEDLASLQQMGNSNYVIRSFERWISGMENTHGYDILDIFDWEQGHGNWLAMRHLEFDIAWKEIITPFNCRELLENMLSVDRKHREPPDYELYYSLISKLWPELLDYPVNPHKNILVNRNNDPVKNKDLRNEMPDSVKKPLNKIQNALDLLFPFLH
ncbi:MAG: hypothetical protein IH588_03280 [Anaerolineales bacterium]|nr:hypothetical protein [Anaerolineales bacterium]